ncbi:hypothetical protein EGW08_020006 [Elysia chlorotica]|uniref:BTB domain-containing protein n=1 Tax=Elysia chlorotica TaxID=188477 RepID=A0A3S1H4V4_ELYCH|nr:hypothetical protein EGW08_020006 [Elysia chlorotica]
MELLKGLNQLFSESLLCDFTIQAGEKCVDVHRCVLAACSPYFKAMLTVDMFENTKRTVLLQNVDSAVLQDLVKFMYTGYISINSSNVQSLLLAADMLQIQRLVQHCEEYMSSSLSTENCLDVLSFADFQNLISTDELIANNVFCHQLISKFVQALSSGGHDPCKEMFCSTPRLGMHSRNMIVFSGGAFSPNDRSFCCFDPVTLQSFYSIKHHPTFDFKFKLDFYRLLVTENNDIYVLGGIFYDDYHFESGGGLAKGNVLVYSEQNGKWEDCASMDVPKCAFGACCYKDKIYVFGGYTAYPGHPPLDHVSVYDASLDVWENLDSMPIGIAHQATTVFRNSAFLLGGIDAGGQYLNTIIQYHFAQDKWTLLSSEMPVPRAEASAFVNDNHIIVLGGSNNTGGITSVNIFDVDRLRWSYASDFPEERKFTSVCQGNGCLFVCGGVRLSSARPGLLRASRSVELRDLYKYDCTQDEWVKLTRIVEQGSSFTCAYASVNCKFLTEYEGATSA